MKRSSLVSVMLFAGILLFAVPAGLLYFYDDIRVKQLNAVQSKIIYAENTKNIDLIKQQITEKLNKMASELSQLSPEQVQKRYSQLLGDRVIRNFSYSKTSSRNLIAQQFLKYAKQVPSDAILLYRNGKVLEANKPELQKYDFARNTKFLQAIPSKKVIQEINFPDGFAEFFIPVTDTKDRLVSVLYVKEDIAPLSDRLRQETHSKNGYNLIVDTAGRVLLNTDKQKEGSENILMNPDLKAIVTDEAGESNVKEAVYNNFQGIFGFKKLGALDIIACAFTPYVDYSFSQKSGKKYESVMFDTRLYAPVYAILGGVLLIGLVLMLAASPGPYRPLRRLVMAMAHIDDDTFEGYLPKSMRKGEYKKLINSLIILHGRIKAADEKANKLSQMSKELEEELSKEASRADAEISELRDAVKIAENSKAQAEEEAARLKSEMARVKKELEQKIEEEKKAAKDRAAEFEKEKDKLKLEVRKSQESKVPAEKENMRMESVLMMNTELKGVLSVIKTYISSVLGGEGKITDAQQQFLGVVINKSARLERLINDLTELALLEKGDVKPAKVQVDINNIVQDIIFAIQPQADIKKVELKVNFSPTIPSCEGDASRLTNVVTQLLNQAIKVSPRGGKVIVETNDGESNGVIKITDYGMSMPQAKANSLFSNFHGPESPSGPEFANSGLRFPILKATLNGMGGNIWIESEIGKGKTFLISLPKKGKTGAAQAAPGPEAAPAPLKTQPASFQPGPSVKVELPPVDIMTGAPPSQEEKPQGFKLQRNTFDTPSAAPATPAPGKKDEPATVSDLLSFEAPAGPKPNLPGKDVSVAPDLLAKPAEPPKASEPPRAAPEELPPLPDLEDDKGGDIL